jgi:hypothetical protein
MPRDLSMPMSPFSTAMNTERRCSTSALNIMGVLQYQMQRTSAENSKRIVPEKELRGPSPNFHIHVSVSDLYIPMIDLPILLQETMWTDPGTIYVNRSQTH